MKLMRCFYAILFFLVAFLPAGAQFNLNAPLPLDPNVRMGKLPNGLTYYIQRNTTPAKKMELRLALNAGSILEDKDQRGLAHFMEHMNFNGSKNFPKNELVSYLQKVGVQFGADLNAYTGFDETVYILPLSTEDPEIVEKGFLVLEDWAFNNLMDKSEIDKERGVVLEESRLSKGAGERMLRQYFPKLFNGSLYANRLPIGNDTVLKTFKYETLNRFYKQWYRPNLMAVAVVGDVDPVEMEKKIKAHFSKYTNPPGAKARPAIIPIAARTKPEALVVTDPENPQTVLQVINFIRPAKQVKTWGDYRQEVVDQMVNSMINQRLEELTKKENAPFNYGYSGMESFIRGYEAFASVALVGEQSIKDALNALVEETERARKFGFLQTELERAKKNLLTQAEQGAKEKDKQQSANLIQRYVSHFLEKSPIIGYQARFDFLKQILPTITLSEVNAVATKMPSNDKAFALVMAPEAKKSSLPTNAALLQDMVAASKRPVTPYAEKAVASALIDKEPVAGTIVSETQNAKLGTTTYTLSNGVTVVLKPTTFKNDEIQMDAWRWGGWHRFGLTNKDNAKMAADMVNQMGVKDMSPTDLQKFLTGKTVNVQPYANEHEEGIQGSSSVKDFETFLQLIHLYFTQPRRDEGLYKNYMNQIRSQLQFVRNSPQIYYQDTLTKVMYNNNPWMSLFPSEAELNAISLDSIMNIYKRMFSNAHGMNFTMVGNIDPAVAKPLIAKYLGSLPASPYKPMFVDNNIRPVTGVVEANVVKGKDPKSMISVTWTGTTEANPQNKLAFRALLDVINIRVIEKLREEMGGMYSGGLGGSITSRPYARYQIRANIPTGPDNVQKLTDALFEIIRDAQTKGLSQKDLDKVKETWKKQHSAAIQQNDYWLDVLSNSFIEQTNPELALEYEKRVDALTLDDLKRAANQFLNMNNYVKVVLFPEGSTPPAGTKKPF